MADLDKEAMFLPVAEAAPYLRLTPAGPRSRIRRGLVRTKRGNQGQHLVEIPRDAVAIHDVHHDAPVAQDNELQAEADELRRDLGEARMQVAVLTTRLELLERAHMAELGAKDSVIAELRDVLVEARRSWWKRWRS